MSKCVASSAFAWQWATTSAMAVKAVAEQPSGLRGVGVIGSGHCKLARTCVGIEAGIVCQELGNVRSVRTGASLNR